MITLIPTFILPILFSAFNFFPFLLFFRPPPPPPCTTFSVACHRQPKISSHHHTTSPLQLHHRTTTTRDQGRSNDGQTSSATTGQRQYGSGVGRSTLLEHQLHATTGHLQRRLPQTNVLRPPVKIQPPLAALFRSILLVLMEINVDALPFDIDFHPSDSLISIGLISGNLLLYRYAADSTPKRLLDVKAHEDESCRAARFIHEGRAIVTGSPDKSILATDVETGSAIARVEEAHDAPINHIINLTATTIASGDDIGCVKVWDTRQQTSCGKFEVHEDYISDMTFASDSMRLLATSGDGTLSVCNLRSEKVQTQSQFSEEELLSVVIMKNGRKVVCGTQNGTLLLYSWGFFKDCSDRFVDLCPNPVDALLKFDEDRLITGSYNGLISLVGILPNQIIQPIAEHSEYPVERLAFSHDKKVLGSISHDNMLKLWDMDEILQGSGAVRNDSTDLDSDNDEMDVDSSVPKARKGTKTKTTSKAQASSSASNNFFADL